MSRRRRCLIRWSEAEAKPFEAITVADAREISAVGFKALSGPPEEVAGVEHLFIPGPTANLPVRIGRRTGATGGRCRRCCTSMAAGRCC